MIKKVAKVSAVPKINPLASGSTFIAIADVDKSHEKKQIGIVLVPHDEENRVSYLVYTSRFGKIQVRAQGHDVKESKAFTAIDLTIAQWASGKPAELAKIEKGLGERLNLSDYLQVAGAVRKFYNYTELDHPITMVKFSKKGVAKVEKDKEEKKSKAA